MKKSLKLMILISCLLMTVVGCSKGGETTPADEGGNEGQKSALVYADGTE